MDVGDIFLPVSLYSRLSSVLVSLGGNLNILFTLLDTKVIMMSYSDMQS